MPPQNQNGQDSDHDASSDEDFNPSVAIDASSSSDSDSDKDAEPATPNKKTRSGKPTPKSRKRKRVAGSEQEDNLELDSGDEVTIRQRERQKKRKKKGKAVDSDLDISEDDEGGQGGFVKTRAQRRVEKEERRPLVARTYNTNIDIESVWQQLSALPVGRIESDPDENLENSNANTTSNDLNNDEEYITIKRRTKFAGQVTIEEKRVHKESAEAKLYLKEQVASQSQGADNEDGNVNDSVEGEEKPLTLQRPLKRILRFEPNPLGEIKGLPPHLQLRWPRNLNTLNAKSQMPPPPIPGSKMVHPTAAKLNVVQKSRHDWAGFVDKQGIAAELDEYGKSKSSYLGREEFLNRTEAKLEEDRRNARLANAKAATTVRYAED